MTHLKPLKMTAEAIEWSIMSAKGGGSVVREYAIAALEKEGIIWENLPEGVKWQRS